ncbi:membrane-spanning 4-domains subfamily A member 14 isoform X1 [Peromyscus eremicus]|uniref:membrane-spanning 4-domains subfamily A member 14 isoform X1 n=1 Tax=Peromyscus eremicus TaxID=42410 RepID=UPI0027DD7501|nr:membrane-spanning 4-domains subfamily A member 14 isoform X1 [Peromyscus eremicus]
MASPSEEKRRTHVITIDPEETVLTAFPYRPHNSLLDFLKGEPKVLGAIQILLSLITVGLGIILAFNFIFFSKKFPLVILTGYPFWGAFIFFLTGFISVFDDKSRQILGQGIMTMNIFSSLVALAGMALIFISFTQQHKFCQTPSLDGACVVGRTLLLGILSVLLIITIAEFSISVTIASLRSRCWTSSREAVFFFPSEVPQNTEQPVPEENNQLQFEFQGKSPSGNTASNIKTIFLGGYAFFKLRVSRNPSAPTAPKNIPQKSDKGTSSMRVPDEQETIPQLPQEEKTKLDALPPPLTPKSSENIPSLKESRSNNLKDEDLEAITRQTSDLQPKLLDNQNVSLASLKTPSSHDFLPLLPDTLSSQTLMAGLSTQVLRSKPPSSRFSYDLTSEDLPLEDMPSQETPSQDTPSQDMQFQDTLTQDLPFQETLSLGTPYQELSFQDILTKDMSFQDIPSQKTPSQGSPYQDILSQKTPSQGSPYQDILSQKTPSQGTPDQDILSQKTPSEAYQDIPSQKTSSQGTSYQDILSQKTPSEAYQDIPSQKTPSQGTPDQDILSQKTPSEAYQDIPSQKTASQGTPDQDILSQKTPSEAYQDIPSQKTPSQGTPDQDILSQKTPSEAYQDIPSQKTASQGTPDQDILSQKTSSEAYQDIPSQKTPSQGTPDQDILSQKTPSETYQDIPSQKTPSQATPYQDTPSQKTPYQDTLSQNTSSQETPYQDTLTLDIPSQDTQEIPSQDTASQDMKYQDVLSQDKLSQSTQTQDSAPHDMSFSDLQVPNTQVQSQQHPEIIYRDIRTEVMELTQEWKSAIGKKTPRRLSLSLKGTHEKVYPKRHSLDLQSKGDKPPRRHSVDLQRKTSRRKSIDQQIKAWLSPKKHTTDKQDASTQTSEQFLQQASQQQADEEEVPVQDSQDKQSKDQKSVEELYPEEQLSNKEEEDQQSNKEQPPEEQAQVQQAEGQQPQEQKAPKIQSSNWQQRQQVLVKRVPLQSCEDWDSQSFQFTEKSCSYWSTSSWQPASLGSQDWRSQGWRNKDWKAQEWQFEIHPSLDWESQELLERESLRQRALYQEIQPRSTIVRYTQDHQLHNFIFQVGLCQGNDQQDSESSVVRGDTYADDVQARDREPGDTEDTCQKPKDEQSEDMRPDNYPASCQSLVPYTYVTCLSNIASEQEVQNSTSPGSNSSKDLNATSSSCCQRDQPQSEDSD